MLAACVSLIVLQLSGLHMHVDAHGYVGAPEATHVHGQAGGHHQGHATHLDLADASHETAHTGDQNHDGDQDVSIVKFGTAVSKLLLYLIPLGLALLTVLRPAGKIAPATTLPRPIARHERWRPPLRAPPRLSLTPSL
jgi:hypothetical protein